MKKGLKRKPTSDLHDDADDDLPDYELRYHVYKFTENNSELIVEPVTKTWTFNLDPTLQLNKDAMIIMVTEHLLTNWDIYKQYITNQDTLMFFQEPKNIDSLTHNEKLLYISELMLNAKWFGNDQNTIDNIHKVIFDRMNIDQEIDESSLIKAFQDKMHLIDSTTNITPRIDNLYVDLTFHTNKTQLCKTFFNYIEAKYNQHNYIEQLQEYLELTNTAKLKELLHDIKNNNQQVINPHLQHAIKLLALIILNKLQQEALQELAIEQDYFTKTDILHETILEIQKIQEILTNILPSQSSQVIENLNLPACDFAHFKNHNGQTIGTILDTLSNVAFTIASETSEQQVNSSIIAHKIFQPIFDISDALKIGTEENQEYINNIAKKINNVDNTEKKPDGTLKYPESECKIAHEDWVKNKELYYQKLLKQIDVINKKFLVLGIDLHIPSIATINTQDEQSKIDFIKESKKKIKQQQNQLNKNIGGLAQEIKGDLNTIDNIEISTADNFAKILRIIITELNLEKPHKITLKWNTKNDSLKRLKTNDQLIEYILKKLEINTNNLSFTQKLTKLQEIYILLYDTDLDKPLAELRQNKPKEKSEHLKQSLIDMLQAQHEQQKLLSNLARNYDIIQEFKNSTLKDWQTNGINGYETHINKLLACIRKGEKIAGYHSKDELTANEQLLQTDVASMAIHEVRKLVFAEEIKHNKKYKHFRNKFLILKDGNGVVHIVNHYGGNRLYKPEDPIPNTKNMTTALLTLGIGHFGDVKAVFLPSGEQKALKIVREGSTNVTQKSAWSRTKEAWDEEAADLIREQTALTNTKQLIASAKIKTFLRKITKNKKQLLYTTEEPILVTKEIKDTDSVSSSNLSSARSYTTPRSTPRLTTPRVITPRVTTPRVTPRSDKKQIKEKKTIIHMAGTAHYMLMELSGAKDLRDEAIKKWEQFLPDTTLINPPLLEPQSELLAVEEVIPLAEESIEIQDDIAPTTIPQSPQAPTTNISTTAIATQCNYILNRAIEACNILKEFHQHGTHNDIKGANIAINRDNQLELIDFGTYKQEQQDIAGQALSPIKHGTAMFLSPNALPTINKSLQDVNGKMLVKNFANIPEPVPRTEKALKEYYIKRRLYDVLNNNDHAVNSIENIKTLITTIITAGNTKTFKTFEELKRYPEHQKLLKQTNTRNNVNTVHHSHAKYMFQDRNGKFTNQHKHIQWTIEDEIKVVLQEIQQQVNAKATNVTMGCDASYDIYALIATISGSANKQAYLSQVIYRYGKLNKEDLLMLAENEETTNICPIQQYAGEGQGLQLDKMLEILTTAPDIADEKKQQFLKIKNQWEQLRDLALLQQPGYQSLTMEYINNQMLDIKQAINNVFDPSIQQIIDNQSLNQTSESFLTPTNFTELENYLITAIEQRNVNYLVFLLDNYTDFNPQYKDILTKAISKAAATKNLTAFNMLCNKYKDLTNNNYDVNQSVKENLFDTIFKNLDLSVFQMSFYDHPELLNLLITQANTFGIENLFNNTINNISLLQILLTGQNKSIWFIIKNILINNQKDQTIANKLKFITRFCHVGFPNNFANIVGTKFNGDTNTIEQILTDTSRLLANIVDIAPEQDYNQYRRLAKIILLASIPAKETKLLLSNFRKLDTLGLDYEEIATIDAIKLVANNTTFKDTDIIDSLLTVQNIKIFNEQLIDVRLDLWYCDPEFNTPRLNKSIAYDFFSKPQYIEQTDALIQFQKNIIFKRLFDILEQTELDQLKDTSNPNKIVYIIQQACEYNNQDLIKYLLNKYKYDQTFLDILKRNLLTKKPINKALNIPIISQLTEEYRSLADILQFTIKECVQEQLKSEQSINLECNREKMLELLQELDKTVNKNQNPLYKALNGALHKKNNPTPNQFAKNLLQQIQQDIPQQTFYQLLAQDSIIKQNLAKFFPNLKISPKGFNLDYYDIDALDALITTITNIDITETQFSKHLKQEFIAKLNNAKQAIESAIDTAIKLKNIIQEIEELRNQPTIEALTKLSNDYPHSIKNLQFYG